MRLMLGKSWAAVNRGMLCANRVTMRASPRGRPASLSASWKMTAPCKKRQRNEAHMPVAMIWETNARGANTHRLKGSACALVYSLIGGQSRWVSQ
jgi:hypothetical protein